MFEGKGQRPRRAAIDQRRPPAIPRPRHRQAIIAIFRPPHVLPWQGRAALVTDQPGDKRRLAPARTAQAEIRGHLPLAVYTLRRIDQMQRRLHYHAVPPMFRPC